MKFRIPFTIASLERLKSRSKRFKVFVKPKKKSKIKEYLEDSDIKISREEYISIAIRSFFLTFVIIYIISTTILVLFKIQKPFLLAIIPSILFGMFIAFSQLIYPKVYSTRKQRNIEKNLLPALEDIMVQLSSGIPLFNILANIASSDYGSLSLEFKKAIRRINAGFPQIEVLEELGEKNPSIFFRRTLWQISNGMKAGSNILEVVKDNIRNLNEEQLLQIQNYGNKLNPLIMFYMLISVILPALAVTFMTIITSLINLSSTLSILLFTGLFVFVVLIQIMFLGVIKSSRPSLL